MRMGSIAGPPRPQFESPILPYHLEQFTGQVRQALSGSVKTQQTPRRAINLPPAGTRKTIDHN